MADAIPDLWPDIEQTQVIPPVAVLKEQASALGRKTNQLLQGRVETRSDYSRQFLHTFYIVAPTLGDYTYELFWIKHGVDQYPVVAPTYSGEPGPPEVRIETEGELIDYIRGVLNSANTKKVVSSLLAQVKAAS